MTNGTYDEEQVMNDHGAIGLTTSFGNFGEATRAIGETGKGQLS